MNRYNLSQISVLMCDEDCQVKTKADPSNITENPAAVIDDYSKS